MNDIRLLIPQHRSDSERSNAAIAAGYPAVAPILPELLEWLQDCNWPVSRVLAPFLVSIGKPLIPHIQHIFDSNDEIWKYWIISVILRNSFELALAFRNELERLAYSPTENEATQELNEASQEVLEKYGWNTADKF